MVWRHHDKNSVTMVYGFRDENNPRYDVVLTLHKMGETTSIYGFLSKVALELADFQGLWDKLAEVVVTPFLVFEVLPEHGAVYRQHLPVDSIVNSKTFNGFNSEILKIRMK